MVTTRRTTRATGAEALKREVRELRTTVNALVTQLSMALETLALMRADQMRIIERLGMPGSRTQPDVHRCADEHDRKEGMKHGR